MYKTISAVIGLGAAALRETWKASWGALAFATGLMLPINMALNLVCMLFPISIMKVGIVAGFQLLGDFRDPPGGPGHRGDAGPAPQSLSTRQSLKEFLVTKFPFIALVGLTAFPGAALGQDGGDAELAKQLSNPVASLISVPFQSNYDCCFGPEDGGKFTLNIQPVIPVELSEDWNLIVRTIVPVIWQDETVAGQGDSFGVGDVTQSFFFTPRKSGGVIWGVGPAILYPLGNDELGTEKWGLGPTALVLKQSGPTTIGLLANHIWSVAGEKNREDISATFLQPFFAYAYPNSTTISIQSESTYDWKRDQWTIPLSAGVSHIYKFGEQRVSLSIRGELYLEQPDRGPEWGTRFGTTFLFPKK